MRNYFQNVTSVEQLTRLIKETYQDEKSAKKEIGHYISQLLSVRLESILKSSGKSISNETGELLKAWGNSIPSIKDAELPPNVGDLGDIPISGFNSGAAFIGGMTGLASLGAMAALVSTIGSNLGAYILVGHVAGWLTTLGLTSSVTTLTSFVAAIGGPITIGIGIAVAIGYAVYKWFSSWEESLAKSVAASIKKNDSWVKIENPINDFWDNTGKSVSAGLKELIRQSDQHIKDLKVDAAKEYDEKKLNVCIQFLKAIKAIKSTIASIFEEYLPKHSA
jgi:gas vesicle protein